MKDDRVYLLHIQDAIRQIREYTQDGRDAFLANRLVQDAVIRNFEIIGEAAKQVSEERRAATPYIRWKQIAGMRDKLIHNYFGVSLALVWEVVAQEIPALAKQIGEILGADGSE